MAAISTGVTSGLNGSPVAVAEVGSPASMAFHAKSMVWLPMSPSWPLPKSQNMFHCRQFKPGEPEKYYPAQTRTYARVVPADDIQGAALVTTMVEDGCKSLHIFNDKTTYGAGLARNIELAAEDQGLTVEGNDGTDRNAPNYRSLAAKVQARPSWIPLGMLRQDPQRSLTVSGEGMLEGTLQPELVSRTYAGGVWTVVVKCPAAGLGIATGKAHAVEVQLERYRCRRGKEPARDYYWMPPMRPPWLAHFRFGRLRVEAK